MALIVVHPFYAYNQGKLTSVDGSFYLQGLQNLVKKHSKVLLYESAYDISQTRSLMSSLDIELPKEYVKTAFGSWKLYDPDAAQKEKRWLSSLSSDERKDIRCSGSYIGLNRLDNSLTGCLGFTMERIRGLGGICTLELSACILNDNTSTAPSSQELLSASIKQ